MSNRDDHSDGNTVDCATHGSAPQRFYVVT